MSVSRTDENISFEAEEFSWDSAACTKTHKFLMPYLKNWLNEISPSELLDLGCGNGALTNVLSSHCHKCTGIDISHSGIQLAKTAYPHIDFSVLSFDAELPGSLQQRYDVVVCLEVIEHLILPRQAFKRAREALRTDGHFIVSVPYHGYLKNLAIALVNGFDSHWHPLRDFGHIKFFSRRSISELFTEQGFKIERIALIGRIPPLARSILVQGRVLS